MALDKLVVKDIAIIALLTGIIFAQEEYLTFLPNIQFTVFLLVLYSKKLGFIRSSIILVLHVILDNLFMHSFNIVFFPAMLVGWMTIPIFINIFCRKTENPLILAIVAAICSFLYCFSFILPNYLVYHINPLAYFLSDIPFEIILAVCGFLTTLILYKPVGKIFDISGITIKRDSLK